MAFFSCFQCFKPVEHDDIQELDLSHFSLSDVPAEIFNFERTLELLNLESNNIRDLPRQLFHCHELKVLQLADNDLHVLPSAISSLTLLRELDVSKNVLTDIPDTIKQCKQLAVLDASVNPLQKIPEGCTQLLSITELYLNDTFLEFLPANFGRLSKLKILELRENGLNALPKSLSRLTCLERLDIGQNEISELPEVIGSLTRLKELWIDGNRIKEIPEWIGNLKDLVHLEASINHIDFVSDSISNCKLIQELALSTNDLRSLPEAIGGLDSLVTLKLDDNQIEELPLSIGSLKNLEELIVSQNFLEHLPPSIGLCRKLHTLNVDDNDLESLPREIGSCTGLRILSAHGNRLVTLPAELDHIANLSVINLTSNMIHYLPVSLTKLTRLTALWLSENQHKPLVQLNQETDPETGQRVLTNFMLPQTQTQVEYNGDYGNQSDSGSFHASSWEEERAKKSHITWAGEQKDPDKLNDKDTSLRREPTPFPKEMRAMAKRAKKLREQQLASSGQQQQQQSSQMSEAKRAKEYRPRMQRKASSNSQDSETNSNFGGKMLDSNFRMKMPEPNPNVNVNDGRKMSEPVSHFGGKPFLPIQDAVEIREAKVSSVTGSNSTPKIVAADVDSKPDVSQNVSPSKSTTSDAKTSSSFEPLTSTSPDGLLSYSEDLKDSDELEQFEALEKELGLANGSEFRSAPEKSSCDSGVITPSEGGSLTSPDHSESGPRSVSASHDPPANATDPSGFKAVAAKAAIGSSEVTEDRMLRGPMKPPPYHIAAAMSKRATDFNSLTRSVAGHDDYTDSVSESETTSTAPSSLQTVLRGPGVRGSFSYGVSETETDHSPPSTPTERYRAVPLPTKGGAGEASSVIAPLSKEHLMKMEKSDLKSSVVHESDAESMQNHAQKLRKVSEQILGGGSSRTRMSLTGAPSPGVTKIPAFGQTSTESPFGNVAGSSMRPSSYAGPQNTVGLPSVLNNSLNETKIPKLKKPSTVPQPPDNGLLSTIEQAAHSDDDLSPPPLPSKDDQRKVSAPAVMQSPLSITRIPKMSTSSIGPTSPYRPPSALSQDYENVTPQSTAEFVALRHGKNISTANYVTPKSGVQHRSSTPTQSRIPTSPTPTMMSKIPAVTTPTTLSKIPTRKA